MKEGAGNLVSSHNVVIDNGSNTTKVLSSWLLSPWHYHHDHHHDIIITIIMTLSWSFFRQAGFSTEDSPQCIIPTVVGRGRHKGAMEVSWQCWLIWNIRLHKGDGDKTENYSDSDYCVQALGLQDTYVGSSAQVGLITFWHSHNLKGSLRHHSN